MLVVLTGWQANAADGVAVDASSKSDVVSFCIRADDDHKVSAEFGVEFRPDTPKRWKEHFPKIVTGEGAYFSMPLRIDLKPRGDPSGQTVHLQFGTCSAARLQCDLVQVAVRVPATRAVAPSCLE